MTDEVQNVDPYRNEDDPWQMLAHVNEECGETVQAIGKTFAFGFESYDPTVPEDKRESNLDMCMREMSDLSTAIKKFVLCIRNIAIQQGKLRIPADA